MHRRNEQCHRASCVIHEQHARRLLRWLDAAPKAKTNPPSFMAAVANTSGAESAAVVLLGPEHTEVLVATSNSLARAAHDLESILGEGPVHDCSAARGLLTTSGAELTTRWPHYGPALAQLGIDTVAAAPLRVDRICLGTLAVFGPRAARPESLTTIADAITRSVLVSPDNDAFDENGIPRLPLFDEGDHQPLVHQAVGMLSAQVGCEVADALELLRAHAFAENKTLDQVAHQVVRGRLPLH
ncbi:ANTAR domain-containing protein [Amycolatopsis anabasis]|uniref:ANTAR domain-containing protein n=1 Tax=Amycolatopsis anabasis TaxID=1840409 RepID=UPI00131D155F|nr:ANTAR domain-containing protein [Amycolatopsis anabasis]